MNRQGFESLVRRLLELPGSVSLQIDNEGPELSAGILRPVLVFELDRPEWFYLKEKQVLATGTATATGAAGTFPQVGLFNPVGSNKLVVLTGISLSSSASMTIQRRLLSSLPGAVAITNTVARDLRFTAAAGGVFQLGSSQVITSAKAVPDGILERTYFVTTAAPELIDNYHPHRGVIMPPGTGVNFAGATSGANTIGANFDFYERTFTQPEV